MVPQDFHVCAWNHKEWDALGLQDYRDFAECVEFVNQEDDYADSIRGQWWYADDSRRIVYSGTFGNDHSPGASSYTYAEGFEDEAGYLAAVKEWEGMPEYVETEEECEIDE